MSERQRPFNRNAEQSALGAALQNDAAMYSVAEKLHASDFFDRAHAEILIAIKELSNSGMSVDVVTVAEMLKRRGMLEAIGGGRYLTELVSIVPTPSGYPDYINIVREHATRRKLIEA